MLELLPTHDYDLNGYAALLFEESFGPTHLQLAIVEAAAILKTVAKRPSPTIELVKGINLQTSVSRS